MPTSKIHNWVEETTATTGTGVITLSGATPGHATFDDQCADGELVNVAIKEGPSREVGLFTFTSPSTLTRTLVYEKLESGVITESPGTHLNLQGFAKVLICQSSQYFDSRHGQSWAIATANLTAIDGSNILADTSAVALTVTLPVAPLVGEKVSVADYAGTFNTNNLTLARNGNLIEGDSSDLVIDVDRPSLILTYVDVVKGWVRVPR